MFVNIFLIPFTILLSCFVIGDIIYTLSKGRIFIKLYHDICGQHLPKEDEEGFNGCSFESHCKICGKEIMQDSQGNWF